MKYLDREGADTFLLLSLVSFDCQLIGLADLELRLSCLRAMVDPGDKFFESIRDAALPSLSLECDQSDSNEAVVEVSYFEYDGRESKQWESRRFLFPPQYVHLVVSGVSGMRKWIFHQFDEDPYPSIPHGHENGKPHPKCDPYTGAVYDRHRKEISTERLSRGTRIDLWNDAKFREFALKSIIWYEEKHPLFSFRVKRPRRLPRPR